MLWAAAAGARTVGQVGLFRLTHKQVTLQGFAVSTLTALDVGWAGLGRTGVYRSMCACGGDDVQIFPLYTQPAEATVFFSLLAIAALGS